MSESSLETKVGFFLLFGLAVVAGLIILFGASEASLMPNYTVTVQFPNAEGLIKGTTVTLAGSPIGRIKNAPRPVLVDGDTRIAVDLRIDKSVNIHKDARFRIVNLGMLGDKGIDILPRPVSAAHPEAPLLANGDVIIGEAADGGLADISGAFTDLGETAKPALRQIHDAAAAVTALTNRVNTEALTPETIANVQESVRRLKSVLAKADELMTQAQHGRGPIGRMLNDPKMADDLSAFIYNLRHKGVLFYGDVAPEAKDRESSRAK